jgi:hypothetical protein
MNIPDQFQKIRVFLANDGFIPVLEKVAATTVTKIKIYSIAC